jgi:hypothetical protein
MVLAGVESFNYTIKKSLDQQFFCWRGLLFFVFLVFFAKLVVYP